MRKLFGTDGVRGVAGVDLTLDVARYLGAAVVAWSGAGSRVVIGRDTRESGAALEDALVEGVFAAGGKALRAGVIPTPGVAVLTRLERAELGCVISASHNPYQDNGLKFLFDVKNSSSTSQGQHTERPVPERQLVRKIGMRAGPPFTIRRIGSGLSHPSDMTSPGRRASEFTIATEREIDSGRDGRDDDAKEPGVAALLGQRGNQCAPCQLFGRVGTQAGCSLQHQCGLGRGTCRNMHR